MPAHSDIDVRMKTNYESITDYRLTRRTPVIIRVDGKAFHTLLRGMIKPFDDIFINTMNKTAQYLCSNIQGCQFGYVQSDEISLLLIDYQTFNTAAWFGNELRKIISVSASMATFVFNKEFAERVDSYRHAFFDEGEYPPENYYNNLKRILSNGALFDSRAFNIPKEEVTNYFYSRQLDATRNSIESTGQAYFSAKELNGKSCNEIQDMLFREHNINWNDFSTDKKRGRTCIKTQYEQNGAVRTHWKIDNEIPIFSGDGREYIERFVSGEPVVIRSK